MHTYIGTIARLDSPLAITCPTRIITYAWGDRYLETLLSINLPALLSAGNLPYVASKVPCELVILTEERFFPKVSMHPAVALIKNHCNVQLIGLDDLIPTPDKYGMALTHILHRGFADLGPAVVDSWQIFLNADFVLADGSLRNLLARLSNGERIVASPSYCVNAEEVIPELNRRIDPNTLALTLPARELARLVLRHRHLTVRGKTINQPSISMRYMDQFYWEADRNTLLGYQMPVAIVGLRPQRHLREPEAYWDHGLMREYCPDAKICVLGDSDEFLMLELRSRDTARDQLSLGSPSLTEIASQLSVFLTPYQREYLEFPLTLHAHDLSADIERTRLQLTSYVKEVSDRISKNLPSHRNHPQWLYHLPAFTKLRHAKLSERLGLLTTTMPPPAGSSALDRAWWKLDALEKSYARIGTAHLEAMNRIVAKVDTALAEATQRPATSSHRDSLLKELRDLAKGDSARALHGNVATVALQEVDALSPAHIISDSRLGSILEQLDTDGGLTRSDTDYLASIRLVVVKHFERRIALLDTEYAGMKWQLQREYESLMPRGPDDASGVPRIDIQSGPIEVRRQIGSVSVRIAKSLFNKVFGSEPRVTRLNPTWASLRHLVRIVEEATRAGAADILMVGANKGTLADIVDSFPGTHARASLGQLLSENFALAFERYPQFDLCLAFLGSQDFEQLPQIVAAAARYMRVGGKLVAFHMDRTGTMQSGIDASLLVATALSGISEPAQVYYSGSRRRERVQREFQQLGLQSKFLEHFKGDSVPTDGPPGRRHFSLKGTRDFFGTKLGKGTKLALRLWRIARQSAAANRAEVLQEASLPPDVCASITLVITITGQPISESGGSSC